MGDVVKGQAQIEPVPLTLLSDPLDFFFAEHFRQRKLCNCIEVLAEADSLDHNLAAEILAFLHHDIALHVQDEEEGLFPLLRRRCAPEDDIEKVFTALSSEHAGDRHLADKIVSGLEAALADDRPVSAQSELRDVMVDFARNERRHLALENSVVLPLARRRLSEDDLAALSENMVERRRGRAS